MLKQRIIAKLLVEDGVAVKYRNFTDKRRVVGDPVSTVRILEDQNVDEYIFCFLGRYDLDLFARMCDYAFVPVAVAGSIRTVDDAVELIRAGAEKVVVKDERLAEAVAMKCGSNAVAWAVDYGGDAPYFEVPDAAGEVVLTSVDRDGAGTGYDLGALRFPYKQPVLLAGGCGRLSHVKDAFAAGASGAVVSSMFAFSDRGPVKLRSWLVSEGCRVRER